MAALQCLEVRCDLDVATWPSVAQARMIETNDENEVHRLSRWSGGLPWTPVSPISDYNSIVRPSCHEASQQASAWGVKLKAFGSLSAFKQACVTEIDTQHRKPKVTTAQRKIVYFVRHGEAIHNIAERAAKVQATQEATELGLQKGSASFNDYLKSARAKVLSDETFRDAKLSELGKQQASDARKILENAAQAQGLPMPTRVLVSPLRRTLETACLAFPEFQVQVCDLLRERKTGLPCDDVGLVSGGDSEASWLDDKKIDFSQADTHRFAEQTREDEGTGLEDASQLRQRTARLHKVLASIEDECICVITHKAWLRELERGPIGREDATEFETAEVRVYDILLPESGPMRATLFT